MSIVVLVAVAVLFLAYSNGANDNMKGVATLLGTRTLDYRRALIFATITTLIGSLVATWVGAELIKSFSGKGLVPAAWAQSPVFLTAVGGAAAATVLLATRLGFPISTTHALTGALVGAGLTAVGTNVSFDQLWAKFALPLLVSPLLAIVGAAALYPLFRWLRQRLGVREETGVYLIRQKRFLAAPSELSPQLGALPFTIDATLAEQLDGVVEVGEEATVMRRYNGAVLGLNAEQTLRAAHFLSAGSVCFARGLNDTPKIAALLLTATAVAPALGLFVVGVAIAIGGVLSARKVAKTMSEDITGMNAGQGFTGNLVTALLVLGASRLGVPVSTTHVSCGALFGIGAVNGQARWRTIATILFAWITTLPIAGLLAALLLLALSP